MLVLNLKQATHMTCLPAYIAGVAQPNLDWSCQIGTRQPASISALVCQYQGFGGTCCNASQIAIDPTSAFEILTKCCDEQSKAAALR
jgi:hypothetical protein